MLGVKATAIIPAADSTILSADTITTKPTKITITVEVLNMARPY